MSKLFKLNGRDIKNIFIMAFLGSFGGAIWSVINISPIEIKTFATGTFWITTIKGCIWTAGAYTFKNLTTNETGINILEKLFIKSFKKDVQEATPIQDKV
jgi:hypothetical protein